MSCEEWHFFHILNDELLTCHDLRSCVSIWWSLFFPLLVWTTFPAPPPSTLHPLHDELINVRKCNIFLSLWVFLWWMSSLRRERSGLLSPILLAAYHLPSTDLKRTHRHTHTCIQRLDHIVIPSISPNKIAGFFPIKNLLLTKSIKLDEIAEAFVESLMMTAIMCILRKVGVVLWFPFGCEEAVWALSRLSTGWSSSDWWKVNISGRSVGVLFKALRKSSNLI